MAPKMRSGSASRWWSRTAPARTGRSRPRASRRPTPDGHTILFGTTGNLAVNPVLYAGRPGMDMARDFTPLSHVASLDFVLVVNPQVPAKSLKELIELAKAKPGGMFFGSSGNGGLPHLSGELLNLQAGMRTVHVPYRGSAPAFTDLISGQVQFVFDALAIAQPHIESGRVRALATTGPKRMKALPDVPAAKETLPNFEVVNWYAMSMRAGTPPEIVTRLQQEVALALRQPDVAAARGRARARSRRQHARGVRQVSAGRDRQVGRGDQDGGDQGGVGRSCRSPIVDGSVTQMQLQCRASVDAPAEQMHTQSQSPSQSPLQISFSKLSVKSKSETGIRRVTAARSEYRWIRAARPQPQSIVTPLALIIAPHFSTSVPTKVLRYAGERNSGATAVTPAFFNRSMVKGVFSDWVVAS